MIDKPMKKPELDRTKPYCRVYGHRTAIYEQAGRLYDAKGCLLPEERASYRARTKPQAVHA